VCYFKVKRINAPVTYLTDDFVNGDTIIYADTSIMPVDFVGLVGGELYRLKKINRYSFEVVYPVSATAPYSLVANAMDYFTDNPHTWLTGCPISVYSYSPAFEPYTSSVSSTMNLQTIAYNENFGKIYKFKQKMYDYIPSIYKETDTYSYLSSFWDSVTQFYQGVYKDGDLLALINYLDCPVDWLPYLLRNLGWHTLTQNSEIWRWQIRYLFPLLRSKGRVSSLKSTLKLLEVDFNYKEKWRDEGGSLVSCEPEPDTNTNADYEITLTDALKLIRDSNRPYDTAIINDSIDVDTNLYLLKDSKGKLFELTSSVSSTGGTTSVTFDTAEILSEPSTKIIKFSPLVFDDIIFTFDYNDYKIYGKNLLLTYPWSDDLLISQSMPLIGTFIKEGDIISTNLTNLVLNNNFYIPVKPTETINVVTALTGSGVLSGSYKYGYKVRYKTGFYSELIQSETVSSSAVHASIITIPSSGSDWEEVVYFRTAQNEEVFTEDTFYYLTTTPHTVLSITDTASGNSSISAASYSTYMPYFSLLKSDLLSQTHNILDIRYDDNGFKLYLAPQLDNDVWGDSLWEGSTASIANTKYTITKSHKSSFIDTSLTGGITQYNALNFSISTSAGTYSATAENGLYKLVTTNNSYPVSIDAYINGSNQSVDFTLPSSAGEIVTISGFITGLATGTIAYAQLIDKDSTTKLNMFRKVDTTTSTGTFYFDVEKDAQYRLQIYTHPSSSVFYNFVDSIWGHQPMTITVNNDIALSITASRMTAAATANFVTVLSGTSTALSGVDIIITPGAMNTLGTSKVDSNGSATYYLAPGEYTVKATKPGYYFTYNNSSLPITLTIPMSSTPSSATYVISGIVDTSTHIISGKVIQNNSIVDDAVVYEAYVVEASGTPNVISHSTKINFENIYNGKISFNSNNHPVYVCDIKDYWGSNKWKNGILVETVSGLYATINNSSGNMVKTELGLPTTTFSGSIYLKVPTEGDCYFVNAETPTTRKWYCKMKGLTRIPTNIYEPREIIGKTRLLTSSSGDMLEIISVDQNISKEIFVYVNDLDLFESGSFNGYNKEHTSMKITIPLSSYVVSGKNVIKVLLKATYDDSYQIFQHTYVKTY
jgi:hypothetical protein